MKNLIQKVTLLFALCLSAPLSYANTFLIKGIESSDIKNNLQIYLQDLNPPVSQYDLDDYQQKLSKQTQKGLQAFGYYNAELEIAPIEYKAKQPFVVNITINLRKVAIVERVILQCDFCDSADLPQPLKDVITKVKSMQGKAIDHSAYESMKSRLSTFALLYGYFDFDFILHKLLVQSNEENSASTATVHWIANLGERYQFGDVVFLDETRGQGLALNVKPFKKGDYFDQTKVGEYSINMSSTRYFNSAIARANSELSVNKLVPIEVILKPKPKDIFKYGIGVSTDTGPRLSVDWERPWVNLEGHSLGASFYVSRPTQSLTMSYRVPKDNPLKDFLNFQVGFKRIDDNDTLSEKVSVAVQRQWGAEQDSDWDKIGFIKLEQESFTQGFEEEQTVRLVLPGVTLNRTRRRGDIYVDWGDRQLFTIEGGSKDLLSDIDLVKVTMRTKWIRQYDKHRVIFRADAGIISTNDFSQVPSSQRFFAGGDQSIRGFGLNEVSDVNELEVDGETEIEILGGKFLSVGSLEYAYSVTPNWRAAVFIDAGSASEEFAKNMAFGYGLGAHWRSPIGDVQVYFARGEAEFERTWRLHLSIGAGL